MRAAGTTARQRAGRRPRANAAEITENRLAEIRELPTLSGNELDLRIALRNADATVDTARAAAEAIRDDDARALQRESRRGLRVRTRFNKAAIRYGFLVCGRGQSVEIG